MTMLNLLGEYDCKLDPKGRLMLPKALQKQLEHVLVDGFVINRDIFGKSLVLYPWSVWQDLTKDINRLNKFVKKNMLFIRKFNSGATQIHLDAQGRLLLPAALVQYAEIKKNIKLNSLNDRIEIWSKNNYDNMLAEQIDMEQLSEDVMGGINPEDSDK